MRPASPHALDRTAAPADPSGGRAHGAATAGAAASGASCSGVACFRPPRHLLGRDRRPRCQAFARNLKRLSGVYLLSAGLCPKRLESMMTMADGSLSTQRWMRLLVGALFGALPGVLLVLVAQFLVNGEPQLTVGVAGMWLAVAGALAGVIVALRRKHERRQGH
jgi:hypothetical protein